ncbi:unnamed protein product [Effrenium voratum]|nr:unnamed protein product [Effrenium voratum]
MVGVLGLAFAPVIEEAQLLPFLVVSRTLSGMCHAGIAVYGSVWVDLYAPKESATSWLGAMQASSLVGLVVGYSIAGYWGQWERVFYLNLLWFAGVFLALFITPGDFLASASRRRARSGEVRLSFVSVPSGSFVAAPMESLEEEQPLASPSGEFAQMSVQPSFQSRQVRRASAEAEEHLPLYFLMATCVSSLFFVSGGLQFWATPYMQQLWLGDAKCSPEMLESAQHLVVTLVASTTLTAPRPLACSWAGARWIGPGATRAPLRDAVCSCWQEAPPWPCFLASWPASASNSGWRLPPSGCSTCSAGGWCCENTSSEPQVPINLLGMAGGAFIPGWMAGCQPDAGEACSSGCNYAVGLRSLLFGPAVGFAALALALAYLNKDPSLRPKHWIAMAWRPLVASGLLGLVARRKSSSCGLSCSTDKDSWTQNLIFLPPSGFWSDNDWYDLQMERRLPLTSNVLREFVYALPPLSGKSVVDIGAGTGRSAAAVAAAYPKARLTLIDPDEGRLEMARGKLPRETPSRYIAAALAADGKPLPGSPYDCVLGLQAVRHIVAPPPHYAAKLGLAAVSGADVAAGYAKMFAGLFSSLTPGGHVFIGDRVGHGHPGVYQHCKLLEQAGFTDVDVAWRQDDWFVIGARRPLA